MNTDFQKKDRQAVILITIDALRPDHLKSYGYHRNTAPNLEKFTEKGSLFLNAITNGPETPTAFSSIFTSILPFLDGGYSPIPQQKIIFPQILKENDINTYAVHSNPNLGRNFNYDRGYDVFLDGMRYHSTDKIKKNLSFYIKKIFSIQKFVNKLIYRLKGFNTIKSWIRKKLPFLTDILLPFTPIAYNAPYIASKLISFFNIARSPFFIWAHFMDTHSPYNPPTQNVLNFRDKDFNLVEREFLTKEVYSILSNVNKTKKMTEDLKILYDSEINFIDENLKEFFEIIEHHIKRNCLIIITADHGESFNEHTIFGHQGSLYEEVLKIPLIIVELGKKSIKKIIPDIVQLIDIAPTILDFFGIEIPDFYQGQSLLPLIRGNKLKTNKIVISECYQKNGLMKRNRKEGFILLAIRKKHWKYIFDEEKNKEFLYNLNSDSQEKTNLIEVYPEKVNEFRIIKDYHINKTYDSINEKFKIVKAIDLLNNKI
ncbi:MAG: sulfatase-like hydrolase/transferase [Candidatus Odinarchaeota archaeon]